MTDGESKRLDELEAKVVDLQLSSLQKTSDDHERRIRLLEETATKLNTITALVFGGAGLSAINLVFVLLHLAKP